MTFRDDIRALAYSVRQIPGDLGVRPYTVSVSVSTWSGATPGEGTEDVTVTAITEANGQPPKVRWLTDEERALGGYADAVIEVGPITPDFPGGGTSWAVLTQSAAAAVPGTVIRYVLTGPEFPSGANFERVGGTSDRTFNYKLRLQRVAD